MPNIVWTITKWFFIGLIGLFVILCGWKYRGRFGKLAKDITTEVKRLRAERGVSQNNGAVANNNQVA